MSSTDKEGELTFEGPLKRAQLLAMAAADIHRIYIRPQESYNGVMTANFASAFAAFPDLRELEIWCKLTRGAVNTIISRPNFRSFISIFGLTGVGRLCGFEQAVTLENFHCDGNVVEGDFLQIAKAPALREIRAHYSKPTPAAIKAILAIPRLTSLDLESSSFNDEMAKLVARSTSLIELEIGFTAISAKALVSISAMQQLQRLDLWANNIDMNDLDPLQDLPALEYLSIGSASRVEAFKGQKLIDKLAAMPALKRLWLDGVTLDEAQLAHLKGRYEYVSYGPVDV